MTPARPESQSRCGGPIVTRVSMRLAGLPPRRFHATTLNHPIPLAVVLSVGGVAMTALSIPSPHSAVHGPLTATSPIADAARATARQSGHREDSPQPSRARATLVPLDDSTLRLVDGAATDPGETWFLGASGTEAHLSQAADEPPPHAAGYRRFAPDVSACGVFLTQVRAGTQVTRCHLCRHLTTPNSSTPGSDQQGGSMS
jgi:hypothetical protein